MYVHLVHHGSSFSRSIDSTGPFPLPTRLRRLPDRNRPDSRRSVPALARLKRAASSSANPAPAMRSP